MKISYNWLQSYIEEPLPEPKQLAEKIIFGAFEVENADELETLSTIVERVDGVSRPGEVVLDIKVLPDRAHDCLSHYGMAREVAGLLSLTLKSLEHRQHENVDSDVTVSLETGVCRRYIARKIFDVKVGPSPKWLSERLEAIGQRSINNIVDATNYIMFSLGQPIHAFDYDKLASGHLIVRQARADEVLTTLDGKIVALSEDVAVIADERHALAIAGVKGGTIAEVDEATKSIVIEVANFDPIAVRKTAKKLNLLTDSAKRFENELTPHLAEKAMHMVTDLIVDLTGGQPCFPIDEYPNPVSQRSVSFTAAETNATLGTAISQSEMETILTRYGYEFENEAGIFTAIVPFERLDITGAHDMAEEIGRAYGYEKITARIPKIDFVSGKNEIFERITAIRNDLVSKGYQEVYTYSFAKKGDFEVVRGPVGKSALRKNLADGLAASYDLNRQNTDLLGLAEMKIFEIGTVFPKTGEELRVAYADKKGITEVKISDYPLDGATPSFREGGRRPGVSETEKEKGGFKMWSEYPFTSRDIAVWVPDTNQARGDLISIFINCGHALIRNAILFDQFRKEGKNSLAFRLVFQSYERTLVSDEVDAIMENIYAAVKEKGWEVR